MRNRFLFLAAFGFVALMGCNVGPRYARPPIAAPAAYRGADDQAIATADKESLGDRQWSAVFRQPELQELIRTALADNYDLRIAAERILEQQAQVRITHAQEFPTVSVGGTGAGATIPSSVSSSISSPLSFGSFISRLPGRPISGVSIVSRPKRRAISFSLRPGRSALFA